MSKYRIKFLHAKQLNVEFLSRLRLWSTSFSDIYIYIYINDLFYSSKYRSFILFADDTNIFFRHKDISTLINTVNNELCRVSSWFNSNKLTLHPDKTKFILFHPTRKKINLDDIHININGVPLSRVENTKFLEVIMHQNLSWKPHINAIKEKTSKVIGVLWKSRHYPLSPLRPYITLSSCLILLIVTLFGHLPMTLI